MNIILTAIKYAVMLIIAFFSFARLTKSKVNAAIAIDIAFAAALGIGAAYATYYIKALAPAALLLSIFLFTLPRYRRSVLTTATSDIIAFGIAIAVYGASYLITLPIGLAVFVLCDGEAARDIIMISIISAAQITLAILFFRSKRIKSGIDARGEYINLMLLVSLLGIFIFSLLFAEDVTASVIPIISVTLLVGGILIATYVSKHITQNYRKRIYKRNEALYEQRINALEAEQAELKKQNEELAAVIHRDNKLIPAIATAAKRLAADVGGGNELTEIVDRLEAVAKDRNRAIENARANSDRAAVPKTGDAALDAVLYFLYNTAARENISIGFRISENAVPLLLERATDKIDINTVLCDLGENALIAVKGVADAKVLVSIDVEDGQSPCVCFYDNGARFDDKVIADLGRRRVTTHKDDGGSGIGLVTLFKILQKYDASFSLDERLEGGDYVKCVKVAFDGKRTTSVLTADRTIRKIIDPDPIGISA
ncbi:MAG: GHKL domain-containing protein [Roseburia sp.]|nr:GHKL domain-containing protein [Roseburia sp.]